MGRSTDGEIDILQSSHNSTAPPVRVKAPFPATGHASAVGKALLADLDFTARMEHLARYEPVPLTDRTITNPRILFDTLDRHGPNAAQFDVLEYSDLNVCAAYSLTLPGHDATCVAPALPTNTTAYSGQPQHSAKPPLASSSPHPQPPPQARPP
ncbi:IclR family transcriptional regulator domain-containing protein [Streptomyces melanogenes]|uniref:IclR family transcriptional regulator domain-containing protein n=1 Tax=Streptomyces melanogenes TaxID=67326 RepID=UPI003AF3871B